MRKLALLLVGLFGLTVTAEVPVTEAIVFKNGLAFVSREGTVSFRDGETRVAPAPEALLGTLWISVGGRDIDQVRASKETVGVERVATSIAALLDANPGRKVTLRIGDREYTGKLLGAPAPELVLLEIDGKVHAFERSGVQSLAFAEPPVLRASVPESEVALWIRAKGADGLEAATIRYLRSGISWMPDYAIELLDDGRARVAMRATLVNDGEDLRDARIRFAVGYPNFGYATVPSPMTLQQSVQEFLARLAGDVLQRSTYFSSNVMTQQVMLNTATARGDSGAVPARPPALGEAVEDLFFYEKEAVTLAKGERGFYPILSELVPFRHLYRWTVPDDTEGNAAADQVWHSISLENRGTTPWTTAPALVLSNGKPLAQDTLAYTAAGSSAEVKLTVATDVAVERDEVEVERKPRDLHRFGNSYDAVIVEGTLTMRSFKREPITVEITKDIDGQSTLRAPEGNVTRLVLQPKAVNPSERLEWQVPLPAGGTATVRYRYKVWVRE